MYKAGTASTVITLELPGGGGHGSPLTRDPVRVAADVREGYVSPERAREDYGVVLDPITLAVDEAQTRALRDTAR